jgi:hypothetical protein
MPHWFNASVATSEPTDFSPIHRLPASRGKCQLFNLYFAGLYVKTAPQTVGSAQALKAFVKRSEAAVQTAASAFGCCAFRAFATRSVSEGPSYSVDLTMQKGPSLTLRVMKNQAKRRPDRFESINSATSKLAPAVQRAS